MVQPSFLLQVTPLYHPVQFQGALFLAKKRHSKNLPSGQYLIQFLLMQTFQLNFWDLKHFFIIYFENYLKNIINILDVYIFILLCTVKELLRNMTNILINKKHFENLQFIPFLDSGLLTFCSPQGKRGINASMRQQPFSESQTPTLALSTEAVGKIISSKSHLYLKK